MGLKYPKTKQIKHIDTYHGVNVEDHYQWLEDYSKKEVKEWVKKQEKITYSVINHLPQKSKIEKRLNELWRYDSRSIPSEVIKGKRIFFYERKKEDEKRTYYTQEDEKSEKNVLINPNIWKKDESLSSTTPSADGKYLAFGKDEGGKEDSKIYIMGVETKKIFSDSLSGRRQGRVSWLHDNSGFFYSRKPIKGEVPEGEEHYWDQVYFHKLGTSFSEDKIIFYHPSKKEYYHTAYVTEDGKYVLFFRTTFGKSEVYFRKVDAEETIALAEGFDADYDVEIIGENIIIKTDSGAPNGRVFSTSVKKPERENWKEIISESKDKISSLKAISGNLYLEYLHNAHSQIKIFSTEGKYIKDLILPDIGEAEVFGHFSKISIWVRFSSFFYPSTTYKYNFEKDNLKIFFAPPIKINSKFITEQVTYLSKDKTPITMFLLRSRDIRLNEGNCVLLTGYGGFGISETPSFSARYITWVESGGIVAIPNLRGGGEYGTKWHESGKLEKKQNVFDDFIAAAEWLIEKKYTTPMKLAIRGASNGGLLVGAVTVQRPELFWAVECGVPLLDMLRYHRLSIANTWAVEYGSSEDPKQFKYLYKYSPYHNVKNNVRYPAMLITTSENDSRVDTMHALKMTAKLQEANAEEVLLLVRKSSGHTGGSTLSQNIVETSEELAFLMEKVGLK